MQICSEVNMQNKKNATSQKNKQYVFSILGPHDGHLIGALPTKKEVYKQMGPSINAMERHKELNVLKQTYISWMYEVSKAAPQEASHDLDKVFK